MNQLERVVLIACCRQKRGDSAAARDLYCSPLFRYSLAYALSLTEAENVHILSAEYGLVRLDETLQPYDRTLSAMSKPDVLVWSDRVFDQLRARYDPSGDEFVFLAGYRYRMFIESRLSHVSVPLKGLGIGRQLQALKRLCSALG